MSANDKVNGFHDSPGEDESTRIFSSNTSSDVSCVNNPPTEGGVSQAVQDSNANEPDRAADEYTVHDAENIPGPSRGHRQLEAIELDQMKTTTASSDHRESDRLKIQNIRKCYEAVKYFSKEGESSKSSSTGSKSSDNPKDPNIDAEETASKGYGNSRNPNIDEEEILSENSDEFVELEFNVDIQEKDLVTLMTKMSSEHYTVTRNPEEMIFGNCKALFEKDYVIEMLDNAGGYLCSNYPYSIIIPTRSKRENVSRTFDKDAYEALVKETRGLRCRARFMVPAILLNNKFICRSGTVSVLKVVSVEKAFAPKQPQETCVSEEDGIAEACGRTASNVVGSVVHVATNVVEAAMTLVSSDKMKSLKEQDKEIMTLLNLEFICDLMVDDRKLFWNVLSVGSSEKINRDIYDLLIDQMPYPGCEFFKDYHLVGRQARDLVFNWNREDCTAELLLSSWPSLEFPDINWDEYKRWDLVDLTKNYFKVLLLRLVKGNGGLLVHCISGWDRTPLIVSLLRLSLWADEVIHQGLNMMEMAYLTLAYDWFLFGHDLPTRLKRKEEILHFCLNFLRHIATDEFSITRLYNEVLDTLDFDSPDFVPFPEFKPDRRKVLLHLRSTLLEVYDKTITRHFKCSSILD